VKGARRDDEDENDNDVVVEYNTSGVYVHNMRRTDSVERDVGVSERGKQQKRRVKKARTCAVSRTRVVVR
jgi:hypothetical protein